MEVYGDDDFIKTPMGAYKSKAQKTVFSALPLDDVGLYCRGHKYRRNLTLFRRANLPINNF
jgi:hypothetical protein